MRAAVGLLLLLAACGKESGTVPDRKPASAETRGAGADGKTLGKAPDLSELASGERFVVRLKREECYGLCPAYTVDIDADGNVTWNGEAYVGHKGPATKKIDAAAVAALTKQFDAIGFMRLSWTECAGATDNPTAITTYVKDGRKRTIRDYLGWGCVPPELRELEKEIDRVAGVDTWAKCAGKYCER